MDTATSNALQSSLGAAPALDMSSIITQLAGVREARALPCGSVVGDLQGGLTFTDAVAAVLEARSDRGWHEVHTPASDTWTIIVVDR